MPQMLYEFIFVDSFVNIVHILLTEIEMVISEFPLSVDLE